MSDPTRLLEHGSDEFEASLLRAGRSDAMSSRSRRQILAGIGIGGLLTASTVASGVRAAAKGWFAKTSIGAAGALAIWAGVRATHPSPPVAPAAAPVAAAAQPVPRVGAAQPAALPAAEPLAEPERTAPETAKAPAPRGPARFAPQPTAETTRAEREASLTAELGAIEQARRAFLARDYSQSLRLLDEYARRFPKRQLASEATVLRIEALAARGDHDAASRVGRDFLQNHPNGPYAQRVRSVIGDGAAH
jgi:TolA-binding protein